MSELSASSLPVPGLELLFRVDAKLGPLEDHGLTRAGHRRVIPIVGGTIRGAAEAEILPSGADWQLVLPDGTVDVDARYSARTVGGQYMSAARTADRVIYDAFRVS